MVELLEFMNMRWDLLFIAVFALGAIMVLTDILGTGTHSEPSADLSASNALFVGSYKFSRNESIDVAPSDPLDVKPVNRTGRARVSVLNGVTESGATSPTRLILLFEAGLDSSELFFSRKNDEKHIFQGESEPLFFKFLYRDSPCKLPDVVFTLSETKMNANLTSVSCGFSLNLTADFVDIPRSNQKVSAFLTMFNLGSLFLTRSTVRQIDAVELNNQAQRIAIPTILFLKLGDLIETVSLVFLGMMGQFKFGTFALAAFFKFMIFSILQARLLIYAWKAQLPQGEEPLGPDQLRMAVQRLYNKFHAMVFMSIMLLIIYFDQIKIWTVVYQLYWTPQIIHDIRRGQKTSLTVSYILANCVARLWFPVYIFGFSDTFFDGKLYISIPGSPDRWFAFGLIILQALQVGIMMSQKLKGPRWFVPWALLPNVYNYYRSVPVDEESGAIRECVICMVEIEKIGSVRSAVTPCMHVFHASCLEQWLEIKMECPTCRRALPPFTS